MHSLLKCAMDHDLKKKEIQTIEEIVSCPDCGSANLRKDYSRAELVCGSCGLVLDEDIIDQRPEWRAFDSEQKEKRSRVGAPMTYTMHDKGLSTTIGWSNRDAYGKGIPVRSRAQLFRLRKWQRRIRISDALERNLAEALARIDRLSSALGLPRSVRETAAVIYRKAALKNLSRGRSIEGVTAASLYAACRQCHVPRTLDEISLVSELPRIEIGRIYRFLSHELELKLLPVDPKDYISRFCAGLNLSVEVHKKTIEILNHATRHKLTSGRGPTGLAAASMYIASILCDERRTQRAVADIAGVTEVTIRNRYKELALSVPGGAALLPTR